MRPFTCKFLRRVKNEDDNTELTILVENYSNQELVKELVKDVNYRVNFSVIKSQRSIEQNKLLWSIIHEIAISRGGERASEDDWDIYLEAIERAGAKFEIMQGLPQIEKILKEQFRAVKKLDEFDYNGQTFASFKVYYGSSKMNTKEMSLLIETVLDMAAEEGIQIDY